MHLGITVYACREYEQSNPEVKAAQALEQSHGVEVTMFFYPENQFLEDADDPLNIHKLQNRVLIYHGGKEYATVDEFKQAVLS